MKDIESTPEMEQALSVFSTRLNQTVSLTQRLGVSLQLLRSEAIDLSSSLFSKNSSSDLVPVVSSEAYKLGMDAFRGHVQNSLALARRVGDLLDQVATEEYVLATGFHSVWSQLKENEDAAICESNDE